MPFVNETTVCTRLNSLMSSRAELADADGDGDGDSDDGVACSTKHLAITSSSVSDDSVPSAHSWLCEEIATKITTKKKQAALIDHWKSRK